MKRSVFCATILFALLFTQGCDTKLTLEQACALAKIGGAGSAQVWVIAAKPTPEQLKAVSGALDVTTEALINYSGKGDFADSLPQIYEGIDKLKIPDELKPMADSLAEAVVLGVDLWFAKNPDWKDKGVDSAKIAKAFVESARNSLPEAMNTKTFKNSRGIKARSLPPPKK
jgi:hypothetical protein